MAKTWRLCFFIVVSLLVGATASCCPRSWEQSWEAGYTDFPPAPGGTPRLTRVGATGEPLAQVSAGSPWVVARCLPGPWPTRGDVP